MKTIWYWHFQRVCDMLLLSTWTASYSLSWLATPYSLYHRRLFLDILTVSTYTILPSIAGGLVLSIRTNSKVPKKIKSVWNKEQYEIAFNFALSHPDGLGPLILMDTGISRSELLGFTWEDIILDKAYAGIYHSTVSMQDPVTLKYYVYTGELKNEYRERIIPFSQQAVTRLKLEYQKVIINGKRKNLPIDEINKQFVISNKKGKAMDPPNWSNRNFKRFMNDLTEEHSIPKLTPHELRHTRSTLWFNENIDPIALCMVGGWCNLNMPRKLYIHSNIDTLKEKLHRC